MKLLNEERLAYTWAMRPEPVDIIVELLHVIICDEMLTEGLTNPFEIEKDIGLIKYMYLISKSATKIMVHALKGDLEGIKREASLFTEEGFIDFLMKLDAITLGVVMTPIKMIAKITGWKIKVKHIETINKHWHEKVLVAFKFLQDYIDTKFHGRQHKVLINGLSKFETKVNGERDKRLSKEKELIKGN